MTHGNGRDSATAEADRSATAAPSRCAVTRSRQHRRPAAAGLAYAGGLEDQGRLARAAHPRRVRRGLRHARRPAAGGQRVRLGPQQAAEPGVRAGRAGRRRAGPGRLRGDHRRRPGRDGGGQPGRHRGRRPVRRARHRAAVRAGHQRLGRHRHRLPLLLRPQDDVREVRAGVRRAARRLRHDGRAVRGADPGADRQGDPVPGGADGRVATGAACWTGCAARCCADGKIGEADLDLVCVTDDVDAAVRYIVDADAALAAEQEALHEAAVVRQGGDA